MEKQTEINYPVDSKVFIGKSTTHFRGVMASTKIQSGELIERCPLVPMSNRSRYQYDPTVWDYLYGHTNCDCKECKNHGFIFYMVLGYGMIYNHSDYPNATWKFYYDHLYADLIASKDISEKEEILVTYGNKYWENRENKYAENN